MAGYYRQLVPNFAGLAKPLNVLTHKVIFWEWSPSQQHAFDALKSAFISSEVMAYPKTNAPYILYTNCCDYALGAILCQEEEEGIEMPIQYISHLLTATQLHLRSKIIYHRSSLWWQMISTENTLLQAQAVEFIEEHEMMREEDSRFCIMMTCCTLSLNPNTTRHSILGYCCLLSSEQW